MIKIVNISMLEINLFSHKRDLTLLLAKSKHILVLIMINLLVIACEETQSHQASKKSKLNHPADAYFQISITPPVIRDPNTSDNQLLDMSTITDQLLIVDYATFIDQTIIADQTMVADQTIIADQTMVTDQTVSNPIIRDPIAQWNFSRNTPSMLYSVGSLPGLRLTLVGRAILSENGLEFPEQLNMRELAIAYLSAGKEVLYEALQATKQFTIVLWIKTNEIVQQGPSRIMTMSKNIFERNLMIGHGASFLETSNECSIRLRLDHELTNQNGLIEEESFLVKNEIFTDNDEQDAFQQIVLQYSNTGILRLWVADRVVERNLLNEGEFGGFNNWNTNFNIAWGNELVDNQPHLPNDLMNNRQWSGWIKGINIYDYHLSRAQVLDLLHLGPPQREDIMCPHAEYISRALFLCQQNEDEVRGPYCEYFFQASEGDICSSFCNDIDRDSCLITNECCWNNQNDNTCNYLTINHSFHTCDQLDYQTIICRCFERLESNSFD
jgi:hypothetical protein